MSALGGAVRFALGGALGSSMPPGAVHRSLPAVFRISVVGSPAFRMVVASMPVAALNITRELEETYPLVLRLSVSSDHALSLGYDDLESMADALAGATVRLTTGGFVSATVDAELSLGSSTHGDLDILLTFALPTTITDDAQTLVYLVIWEPGSTTAERVLCQGSLTIRSRPTA